LKRLSRYDIERIAVRVVTAYKALPELAGQEIININPELVTKSLLGLSLEYRHLSLDETVLGLTAYDQIGVEVYESDDEDSMYLLDGKTVLVESDLKADITRRGRLNFTIIHEASHHVLKMVFPTEYGIQQQPNYYRATAHHQSPVTDWEEWQANSLAAAILLPRELVVSGMQAVGLGNKLEVLNRIFHAAQYERFCQLADLLGVSKSALAIRMKQFKLLGQDYLGHPYDLINVWPDKEEIRGE